MISPFVRATARVRWTILKSIGPDADTIRRHKCTMIAIPITDTAPIVGHRRGEAAAVFGHRRGKAAAVCSNKLNSSFLMKKHFNWRIVLYFIIGVIGALCYLYFTNGLYFTSGTKSVCAGYCKGEVDNSEVHRARCGYHPQTQVYYDCNPNHGHGSNCWAPSRRSGSRRISYIIAKIN